MRASALIFAATAFPAISSQPLEPMVDLELGDSGKYGLAASVAQLGQEVRTNITIEDSFPCSFESAELWVLAQGRPTTVAVAKLHVQDKAVSFDLAPQYMTDSFVSFSCKSPKAKQPKAYVLRLRNWQNRK